MKLSNGTNKNVVETMAELKAAKNINLGIEEIEFPDGTKEKFYYNGEEDKQAAINFAQICFNATNDTAKAKRMMQTCFTLLTKGITPTESVVVHGGTCYIDHEQKLICDSCGNTIAKLTKKEQAIEDTTAISSILKERARSVLAGYGCYDDDE